VDEGTARFGFLGALGLTTLCAAASLWLGLNGQADGARLFLALALGGVAATLVFRRIYHRRRRVRWERELRASQRALDTLLQPTPAGASEAVPAVEPEPGPAPSDTNAHT
jgi:uncharacterized membrane protein YccC